MYLLNYLITVFRAIISLQINSRFCCVVGNVAFWLLILQLAQTHREYYQDKSGTKKRVDFFVIPTSNEDQFKKSPAL